jgi:hypothetical protein
VTLATNGFTTDVMVYIKPMSYYGFGTANVHILKIWNSYRKQPEAKTPIDTHS